VDEGGARLGWAVRPARVVRAGQRAARSHGGHIARPRHLTGAPTRCGMPLNVEDWVEIAMAPFARTAREGFECTTSLMRR